MTAPERTAAKLALYTPDTKEFLMVRGEKLIEDGGYWGFLGGGMKRGETPPETLVREAEEEVGIDLAGMTIHHVGTVERQLLSRRGSPYTNRWLLYFGILGRSFPELPASTPQVTTYMDIATLTRNPHVSSLAKTSIELIKFKGTIDQASLDQRSHLRVVR